LTFAEESFLKEEELLFIIDYQPLILL